MDRFMLYDEPWEDRKSDRANVINLKNKLNEFAAKGTQFKPKLRWR